MPFLMVEVGDGEYICFSIWFYMVSLFPPLVFRLYEQFLYILYI